MNLDEPIEIDSDNFGEIKLKWISLNSLMFLEELLDEHIGAHEFVVKTLHEHWIDPDIGENELNDLEDSILYRLAQKWAKEPTVFAEKIPFEDFPEKFMTVAEDYIENSKPKLDVSTENLFPAYTENIKEMEKMVNPPGLKISPLIEKWQEILDNSIIGVIDSDNVWSGIDTTKLAALDTATNFSALHNTIPKTYLNEIQSATETVQQAINIQSNLSQKIANHKLGGHEKTILEGLNSLSRTAGMVSDEWASFSDKFEHLPEILRSGPAVEVYSASESASTLLDQSSEIDVPDLVQEKRKNAENTVEEKLKILDPDLVNLYQGAKEAIESDGTDRVRHFSSSLRGLLTHLMHKLAPDNEVENWTDDPDDFHDGKPTRRARIKYIYSFIETESYVDFMDEDIEQILSVIDYLNKGTHKLSSSIGHLQMKTLLKRVEAVIPILLSSKEYD